MKKITLLFFSLLCAIATIAQPLNFTLQSGVNYSIVQMDLHDSQLDIGFQVGISTEYEINEKIALSSGVVYKLKKSRVISQVDLWNPENNGHLTGTVMMFNDVGLGYIQIPILLKYQLTKKIDVIFGPQVEIKVHGDASFIEGNYIYPIPEPEEQTINSFDYGIVFGVEYAINRVGIRASYNANFADVYTSLPFDNNFQSFELNFLIGVN